MNDVMQFLRKPHPFDYLSEPELKLIEEAVKTEKYPRRTHILEQNGSPSHYLYVVKEGTVHLARDGKILKVIEEGECFGHPSIITRNAPTADAITEETVLLYKIPKDIFLKLLDNHKFAEFYLKDLGERLRRITSTEVTPLDGQLVTPIGDLVVRKPITVSPLATVSEAAKVMRKAWVDAALVMDNPPGIITDHDFQVKVLAEELGPNTPTRQVMSKPLKSLPQDTPVHGALLFMLEENIHHLPVITPEGKVMGIVTATDLLRHQTRSPLYLMRQLQNLESPDTLAKYAIEVAGMVENLYRGGLDIAKIGQIIASVNDALLRRLLRLAEEKLGPPPTPYAWIVFGSEGRMEQTLITDQDNALIYQTDSADAQKYFKALAGQVVDDLIKAGFPPCPGGYMATNWCKSLDQWIHTFKGWIQTPNPQALLETSIFFDFRAIYGDLSVEPLEQLVQESGEHSIFLAQLARAAMEFRPPLGFFRRIRSDKGQVDLKAGGIAPIVSLARIYALEAKSRANTTLERLEAAALAGTLSQVGADTLIEMYRFLLQLRLQAQLATIREGNMPGNKIQLQALSSRETRHLKDAFQAIREMQDAAASQFRTDLLG